MQKNVILGCIAALLSGLFAIATPANAYGGHYGCGCRSYYAHYYPVYAPPSYTSLYYGTFRGYPNRRYIRWRRR